MESVFAKGDRGAEKNYRGNVLYGDIYPKKKKAKKIQKEVFRHTTGVAPPAYEIASVHIGPDPVHKTRKEHRHVKKRGKRVMFDICACEREMGEQYKDKYLPKTWDSLTKFYGDTDTTEVWNSKNQIVKVNKENYNNKQFESDFKSNDKTNGKNKYKTKSKTQKNHAQYSKKQIISNELNQKNDLVPEMSDTKPQGASVISLFRNNRNNHGPTNKRNSHNTRFSPNSTTEKKCNAGRCEEAAKNKNKLFLCKCVNKKRESEIITKDCTVATCKESKNALNRNSVIKFKDKLLCICHKYSQKIVNLKPRTSICKEGVCREAELQNKYDFNCKCDKNRIYNECTDKTCGKYTKANIGAMDLSNDVQALSKRKSSIIQNIYTKFGLFKEKKQIDDKLIKLEHVSEQTGEPFFEVHVNPRDMCVLNPIEIRENILKYGKPGWNDLKCICPSRGRLKPGEVCASGVCKKAYKNKQTNFKCWCDRRITECGDTTCAVENLKNTRRRRKYSKQINIARINKPLLEVKLDRDKMCVVNPKEIEEKMINNMTVDDVCFSGVCKSNAKDSVSHFCKCISRKMTSDITECSEDTCTGADHKKKSKSENWSFLNRSRKQKRPKRRLFYEIGPNKLCRGKICSKSDNLYRNKNLHLNEPDVKHLPTCNCQECKLNKKYSSPPKEKKNNQEMKYINNNKKNMIQGIIESHETKHHNPKNNLIENKVVNQSHAAQTVTCTCAHACECNLHNIESDSSQFKNKDKIERKKLKQKLRNKKISHRTFEKEMKRRAKLDKKGEKRAAKERLREIRTMQKKMKEEPLDTNCFTAFLLGILKVLLRTVMFICSIIISVITDPKGSFWYARDRLKDPKGTFNKLRKWFNDALMIKKLQISETVRGSDTLTILTDHFLDTPFYQSFADKGKTKKEQMMFEQKSKARKRRIRKREQQAIYSCRHNLLTTLRKTPCLWVYHICPNFYPQCLGLLAFMRNFCHMLLFLVAFACWTPCIVSFELCRAVLCCFMCTH